MVVFVMSKPSGSTGPYSIRSRHVEVVFPDKNQTSSHLSTQSTTPVQPRTPSPLTVSITPTISRPSAVRFSAMPTPRSLIPDEWMQSLVQYVASLKKILYDTAREDLSSAIKGSIPLELKHRLGKCDLLQAGLILVGQVAEPVSTHQTLTSQMSMRRLKEGQDRPSSAGGGQAFMNVSAHYMNLDADIAKEEFGRLDALKMNALQQQARSLLGREKTERRRMERLFGVSRTALAESLEEEMRAAMLMEEDKIRNKMAGAEVGAFLACKKRDQLNTRSAVVQRAADLLRGEKDALREMVLSRARVEHEEVAKVQTIAATLISRCVAELPLQPNATAIDAEVARLILRERRKEKKEYFPDIL